MFIILIGRYVFFVKISNDTKVSKVKQGSPIPAWVDGVTPSPLLERPHSLQHSAGSFEVTGYSSHDFIPSVIPETQAGVTRCWGPSVPLSSTPKHLCLAPHCHFSPPQTIFLMVPDHLSLTFLC